uniref:Uncharacterized protein n=1 Tax=Anopheles atroparvus TaxID=41427 RepID=A0AAG5D0X3_ANOAO
RRIKKSPDCLLRHFIAPSPDQRGRYIEAPFALVVVRRGVAICVCVSVIFSPGPRYGGIGVIAK